jgi:hypothetical protein
MKPHQKQYEQYMKSITDGFAKTLNFESGASILVGEGNHVSVMIYQYQEYLLEFDKNLKHMYRPEYYNKMTDDYKKERQQVAEKFLNENTLTYDQWVEKYLK